MSSATTALQQRPIVYPESDGLPMADNTRQFAAIVTIKENLEIQFADELLVFVAGNHLWYPVEGNNKLRAAPDAFVVFGVPKGHRGSYRQWEEGGIAPQVVFEVQSPGNRTAEMTDKFAFYDRNGVEEYYLYDPDEGLWDGWLRHEGQLQRIETMHNFVSPRLGIRFESEAGTELTLFHPNGDRFLSSVEMDQLRREAVERSELDRLAREQAQRRADAADQRADAADQRAARLAAQLRAAGIEPS